MFKSLMREVTLAIQARNGASLAVLVWFVVTAVAVAAAFVFLCVAGYDWLALRYDTVSAGLIMTAIFVGIGVITAIVGALVRRRVRQRALLARAASAQTPPWLLDPRLLALVTQFGRDKTWQRLIPIAVLGFFAAQWARERRGKGKQDF